MRRTIIITPHPLPAHGAGTVRSGWRGRAGAVALLRGLGVAFLILHAIAWWAGKWASWRRHRRDQS